MPNVAELCYDMVTSVWIWMTTMNNGVTTVQFPLLTRSFSITIRLTSSFYVFFFSRLHLPFVSGRKSSLSRPAAKAGFNDWPTSLNHRPSARLDS